MTASLDRLRRLPVPLCEPPYDDEIGGDDERGSPPATWSGSRSTREDRAASTEGTLALAFVLPSGVPAVPSPPPGLRLVSWPEAEETLDVMEFGVQRTRRTELPDPRSWAATFVQAVVETLGGDRPASQLIRWTTGKVHDQVRDLVSARARAGRAQGTRAVVRSVHVTEPADGVAEVAALVRRGVRSTAIALRLEGMDGRWQCTALELG